MVTILTCMHALWKTALSINVFSIFHQLFTMEMFRIKCGKHRVVGNINERQHFESQILKNPRCKRNYGFIA